MNPALYSLLMLLISLAAYSADVTIVRSLALGLWIAGMVVYSFQTHPVVREWLERCF